MKLFSSKYFGDFTLFDFEDCTGLPEILTGLCEYGNSIELFKSIVFSIFLVLVIFGIYYHIKKIIKDRRKRR